MLISFRFSVEVQVLDFPSWYLSPLRREVFFFQPGEYRDLNLASCVLFVPVPNPGRSPFRPFLPFIPAGGFDFDQYTLSAGRLA